MNNKKKSSEKQNALRIAQVQIPRFIRIRPQSWILVFRTFLWTKIPGRLEPATHHPWTQINCNTLKPVNLWQYLPKINDYTAQNRFNTSDIEAPEMVRQSTGFLGNFSKGGCVHRQTCTTVFGSFFQRPGVPRKSWEAWDSGVEVRQFFCND